MTERVAIVGGGFIGRAWAIGFARSGWEVVSWDPQAGAVDASLASINDLLADLADYGLLADQTPAAVRERLKTAAELSTALEGADWVQENAPERIEVKRQLWRELDRLAPEASILASSSSAIVPSRFTEELRGRARCIVAHPINPPYLIPAVELVPAPWTAPATMTRAEEVMRSIGQAPIVMKRELDGFVMNRMQGALLEEAFRLVDDGYCTVEDVDIGIRDGLALRWSFMGPFETIDLNAPEGVSDYVRRYQDLYRNLLASMQRRVDWAGPVLETIERQRRERVPETELAARQRWRDRRLMALAAHKREARRNIGD
jgi:L-gulonate 3-dehydrogenase